MVFYGYNGSMKTHPGKRDDVVAILLGGVDGLGQVGCLQYTVAIAPDDEVTIWVSEVWESEEAHAASLELAETKAAIAKAMPLLTGEFAMSATEVRGGLGLA
jgi:quinol monooxygenase YgiN